MDIISFLFLLLFLFLCSILGYQSINLKIEIQICYARFAVVNQRSLFFHLIFFRMNDLLIISNGFSCCPLPHLTHTPLRYTFIYSLLFFSEWHLIPNEENIYMNKFDYDNNDERWQPHSIL